MMKPHQDSDDLRNLVGNSRGCGCFVFLIALAIAFVVWQASANEPSKAYIQHVIYRPNVGIAWLAGTQEDAGKLGAYYHYACCSACPPPGDRQIPITRPGTFWADCPGDYEGYILVGNEGEFCRSQDCLTPSQMAQFIEDARDDLPDAVFVCLNSYDLDYMLDVIALLPSGVCDIWGIHIYDNVDISDHLDRLCEDCRIWISEIGQCGTGAQANMERMVGEALADGRIERIFGYTSRAANPSCLNMLTAAGDLRPSGVGFMAGLEAYP